MLPYARRQMIIQALEADPRAGITELSKSLQVSEATIRRDLDALSKSGRVQRVHGGAVLVEKKTFEAPISLRVDENASTKARIGVAAAGLIRENEAVFIGSGTTAYQVACNILHIPNLTVITNSLSVAILLAKEPNINLVCIGGYLRHSELSFIGHIAEQALQEVRADKVIISIPAIDFSAGLTNDYLPEVKTDRAILNVGTELILVADHSKFNKVASAFLAPLDRVDVLVTDNQTDPGTLDRIRAMNVRIVIADS